MVGVKKTITGIVLAGWFLLALASVGQATHQVTLTATDQGNGGVALTGQTSNDTVCCSPVYPNSCWTTQWLSVRSVTVNGSYACGDISHDGLASCTVIIDRGRLHGTHTYAADSMDCKDNRISTTATTTFDNTPSVSVTGPSGTVSGPFDVTGTVTFKPTLNSVKGDITAYIDNRAVTSSKQCFTETCTYSYEELAGKLYDMNHGGPYTVKFIARGGGATAEATGSFSVDKMPTIEVTGPSGTVSEPFDVTGTATFKPTLHPTKGTIYAYINNGYVGNKYCTTESCTFSYQEVTGKLYDMNHGGPYTIKMVATGGGISAEDSGSFSVNKMPTVEVTGPSGTVSEPFDVTGTATFKPTLHPTKGTIYAYINNGYVGNKYCTTESCTFSYQEVTGKLYDMNHGGPHTIKMVAIGGGATAEDTDTFNVDKMPTVAITTPPGGNVKTPFEIAGTATFKPTLQATKGTIYAYINNGSIGFKTCATETCQYSYEELYGKPYAGSVGSKVLKLTATGGGASASDEREIYVEDLMDDLGEPNNDPGESQPQPKQPDNEPQPPPVQPVNNPEPQQKSPTCGG